MWLVATIRDSTDLDQSAFRWLRPLCNIPLNLLSPNGQNNYSEFHFELY